MRYEPDPDGIQCHYEAMRDRLFAIIARNDATMARIDAGDFEDGLLPGDDLERALSAWYEHLARSTDECRKAIADLAVGQA